MHLRRLLLSDAPFMLEWMHDKSVTQYLRTNFDTKTLADAESFIRNSWTDQENLHMAIADETDTYMGTVSLKHIKEQTAEFAITVRSSAMGQGYAWFGMKKIMQHAFNELGVEQVYWCVSHKNVRAIRFYDKHGFQETIEVPQELLDEYQKACDYKWYCTQNMKIYA